MKIPDTLRTSVNSEVRFRLKILASTNAAAVDIAACQMIGYEPEDIQMLQCAKKRHMIMDYDDVGMSRKGNQDKSNTSK